MARAATTTRKPAKPPPARLIERTPVLEWVAAGVGLVLILGAVGYLLWEGLNPQAGPPVLVATAERITPTAGGYVVDVTVENRGRNTAAEVEVEGTLRGGQEPETAAIIFDYVPGRSRRTGGLVFQADPRRFPLAVVAKGHVTP